MKAKLLFLILLLLPITIFAQSEHLTFKGIPIDGTLRQFSSQLTQKGFIKLGSENGQAMLTGDFAGYKDCYVFVSSVDQKDLVYLVGVMFPALDQWGLLEANYTKLKKMLTTKYGEPSEVVENFQSMVQPRNDSDKLYELKFDRCTYKTIFDTEKGRIALSLAHEGVSKCYVILAYIDGINGAIMNNAAMDDL